MPQPAKRCLQGTFEAICRFSPECVAGFWMIFGLKPLGDEGKAFLHSRSRSFGPYGWFRHHEKLL